jgi:hypothetical protein
MMPDDTIVARTVDPDQAVLLVHFVGHVPQPALVLAEHLGNAGNGVVNLVNWRQSSGCRGNDGGRLGGPVPGKQFVEPVSGMPGDPGQDVRQSRLGVDVIHLGRDDEAVHRGGSLTAAIRAAEHPGFSPKSNAA